MLTLYVSDNEYYNEETSEFIFLKGTTINLEHSLVSLSKWEAKWCKPFLGKKPKTKEETIDYIRCMTIDKNIPDHIYYCISNKDLDKISEYINQKMTATTFSDNLSQKSNEVITSEIIYYWMISLNIPFECQKWHLNRLLTLIRVCSIKNTPPKKLSKSAILNKNNQINSIRKQQLNTKG